jgi:hypothetical protein
MLQDDLVDQPLPVQSADAPLDYGVMLALRVPGGKHQGHLKGPQAIKAGRVLVQLGKRILDQGQDEGIHGITLFRLGSGSEAWGNE